MIDRELDNVAVIGAGGKMGRGIALLILQEMALQAEGEKKAPPTLTLVDSCESALLPLKHYLRSQLYKFAEKNIVSLRRIYSGDQQLVSNGEIIAHFATRALDYANFSIALESAKNAKLLFEAVVEEEAEKIALYKKLKTLCSEETLFFSNTSSIPLYSLTDAADLGGRLIGLHFYNPPAVQKLIEIIPPKGCKEELKESANLLANRLKKCVVYAKDVAGFIGNGYFIREGLFACHQVDKREKSRSKSEAVYIVNRVTEEFLIRPMGIFQLIDYVGIDIFCNIAKTMRRHLKEESLHHPLIEEMVEKKLFGGQYPNGEQKPGFFRYDGTKIEGYYDFDRGDYLPLKEAPWKKVCDLAIGPLPEGSSSWKALVRAKEREELLKAHFHALRRGSTLGNALAEDFLSNYSAIARRLVDSEVASSLADVTTVLKTGFFHLYGPDAAWLGSSETAGNRS